MMRAIPPRALVNTARADVAASVADIGLCERARVRVCSYTLAITRLLVFAVGTPLDLPALDRIRGI